MSNTNFTINFLPYLKQGQSANLKDFDYSQARFIKTVHTQLIGKKSEVLNPGSSPFENSFTIRGPQDVVGINANAISRIFPSPGTNDFENNLFCFLEFKEPDLPWRYSLSKEREDRLIPWISLIVLEKDTFHIENDTINNKQQVQKLIVENNHLTGLPNLADSWAWAHVQYTNRLREGSVEEQLKLLFENEPELNCSRIMCPRLLKQNTCYSAFLIPCFEIGRLAGIGAYKESKDQPGQQGSQITPEMLLPWTTEGKTKIELPIYFQWDFQTGEEGDFETLVKKIEPKACPPGVGRRIINGSINPDGVSSNNSNDNFHLEGALLPLSHSTSSADSDTKSEFFRKEILLTLEVDSNDELDPLISIPVYGKHYKNLKKEFKLENSHSDSWPQQINLKRNYRTIASIGTDVITKNQDDYMMHCWNQAGEIKEANEEIRRASLGRILNKHIQQNHLDKLDKYQFCAVTRSLHPIYGHEKQSFNDYFQSSGIPAGMLSIASQKVFRKRLENKTSQTDINSFARIKSATSVHSQQVMKCRSPLNTEVISLKDNTNKILEMYRNAIDSEDDIKIRLNSMIRVGESSAKLQNLNPIMMAPKISYPMYKHLKDLSVEYMVPNLQLISNNCVTLLQENRKFIETYMLGLNHEMNRELIWREFPSDNKGTIFSHFWDSLLPENKTDDIKDIYSWGVHQFGNNHPLQDSSNKISMILGIKADLIRRYPDAQFHVVYDKNNSINLQENWEAYLIDFDNRQSDINVFEPEYYALVGSDTLFLGFPQPELSLSLNLNERLTKIENLYFIISEIAFLPRFGLDIGLAGDSIDNFSWGNFEVRENDANTYLSPFSRKATIPKENEKPFWDSATCSSAKIAKYTMQMPVRVMIPGKLLIP